MNAREIEYIEARLRAGPNSMPSPEQMEMLIAHARHERNREMAAGFARMVAGLKGFAGQVRKIAAACTDARLHHHNV